MHLQKLQIRIRRLLEEQGTVCHVVLIHRFQHSDNTRKYSVTETLAVLRINFLSSKKQTKFTPAKT